MTASKCTVAIAGAGPAGLATALALSHIGAHVSLIAPQARDISLLKDTRTAALFAGSIDFLKNLGAWSDCESESEPITAIRLIDDTGSLFRAPEVTFQASDVDLEAFGFNVPNVVLLRALQRAILRHEASIDLRFETTVAKAELSEHDAHLTLSDGAKLSAQLVAAADGRNSLCRRAAGIGTRSWTYPQSAVVCSFDHQRSHNGVSTEFHRPHGPLTTVPLPGKRSSLVWVESPGEASRLCGLDDAAFRRELETRLQGLLGSVGSITPRAAFPLSGLTADQFASHRVALIGEAAHVIPPIGAQGLNLGMRDGATLADCVAQALARAADPGGPDVLSSYHRARTQDIASRIYGVDALNRSLLADILPVHLVRGLGLFALSAIGPLRRYVVREGLQPSSATPPLMRPAGDASRASA